MKREFTLDEMQRIRSHWWDSAQDGRFGDKLRKLYEALAYHQFKFTVGNCERITMPDGTVIDGTPVVSDSKHNHARWHGPLTVTQCNGIRLVDTERQLYVPGKWELEFADIYYALMQEKRKAEEAATRTEEQRLTRELLLTEDEQIKHAADALAMLRGLAG